MISTDTISGKLGNVPVGDRRKLCIIGVINLTKNSFYAGSVKTTEEEIEQSAITMQDEGADIIDVGARSTAPYRKYEIREEAEKKLLIAGVKRILGKVELPVSVDTTRLEPARAAVAEGASILNDVYGFTQKDALGLARLVASKELSLLTTAHERIQRKRPDPVERISACIEQSLDFAEANGIDARKITIDPGIGFFKDSKISNVEWNCSVIRRLRDLRRFQRPICVGVSRKRFLGDLLDEKSPEMRLYGSLGATAIAVCNGAHVIRTHDVLPTLEAAKVALAIRKKGLIRDDD